MNLRIFWRDILLLFAFPGICHVPCRAQPLFAPNWEPSLNIPLVNDNFNIDGKLDEIAWQQAAVAENFTENFPDNGKEPPVATRALIAHDARNLYIAFIAYDDPASVRYSLRARDDIWSDDYIGLILDTNGDAVLAYEIFVNPLGLQGDGIQTLNGEDISFDIIFHSKGAVTDSGYQVELALPFSSLRFPNRSEQTWKATIWRTRPREDRDTYTWASVDDDKPCWICQFGTFTGIKDVKPGGKVEIIPSIVGFQTSQLRDFDYPDSGMTDNPIDGEFGFSSKYFLSSSMTAEVTINPDFSQVESDATEIDFNSSFALFYPEKRPFFQEGSDLFSSAYTVFYTRSINNSLVAARITGRLNKTDLAYLVAYDEDSPVILPFEFQSVVIPSLGESVSNIFRLRQSLLENSSAGFMIVDRRLKEGGGNIALSADGRIRFLNNYQIGWQFLTSHTEEPVDSLASEDIGGFTFDNGKHTGALDGESYRGNAMHLGFDRDGKHWFMELDFSQASPTFRADNGFIVRNGNKELNLWTQYLFYPQSDIIERIGPSTAIGRVWDYRDLRIDEWIVLNLYMLFKHQTRMELEYLYTKENFRDFETPDIYRFNFEISSDFSEPVKAGLEFSVGPFVARFMDPVVMADGYNFGAWVTLKPATRLSIEPSFESQYLKTTDGDSLLFKGYSVRIPCNLQFSRELALRLITQYYNAESSPLDYEEGSLSFEPLLTYKLNSFSIFYIGSSQHFQEFPDRQSLTSSSRQYFMKFQYLFRL